MERNIYINNSLLLPRNNIPQINRILENLKLKNILFFNIILLLLISFSLFFYYYKINHSFIEINKVNNENSIGQIYINNNFSSINNNFRFKNNYSVEKAQIDIKNSNFKSFSEPIFYQITRERYLYEKQKQSIMTKLINHKYYGTWESFNEYLNQNNSKNNEFLLFHIGNSNNGDAIFIFDKAYEIRSHEEAIALNMKNIEGKYIDHWIKFISYQMYQSLYFEVNRNNETFQINGRFLTDFEKGECFETIYKRNDRCSTIINMTFPLIYEDVYATLFNGDIEFVGTIPTINTTNFTLLLKSTCGFIFKVEGKIYSKIEKDQKLNKLKIYYYLVLFSSILYIFGIFCLLYGIKTTEMAISAFNIECLIMISIWNFYCFCSNIYLAFKEYFEFFPKFAIISIFSLSKFLVFDSLFFVVYWKIKERIINNECILIKLKIRFYAFFIIISILSFFFIPYFYIDYYYISFISIILWIPQIIYNIISKNRYGFPFLYILACTIDRLIYPFYFRAFKDNFFKLKVNNNIFIIILFCIILSIIFLLIQTFRGPRFMLNEKYQEFPYTLYKNKDELENTNDINNEECVICLMPIFEDEEKSNKIIEMNEINSSTDLDKEEQDKNIISKKINENKNNLNNSNINEKNSKNNLNDGVISNVEEELDISDGEDNNKLLIKDENKKEIIKKEENNNIIINKIKKKENLNDKKKNNIKFMKDNIFKVISFLNLFFKKNFLFFYKSSANIHNKLYMLTPCKHIFHSECLEKWFEQKKECPNCRTSFENII